MIIARCANGVVGFRVTVIRSTDSLTWHCLNDGSTGTQPRTDAGLIQFTQDMSAKAVALRGALQQVVDLAEVV